MRRAFTLIELVAVIVVLAILAGVAVPRYFDYRERAQASAIAGSFKALQGAILRYQMTHGGYPPDVNQATPPTELAPFVDPSFWAAVPPIGGRYDYENWLGGSPVYGIHVSIRQIGGSNFTSDHAATMARVDAMIDDGNTSTGRLVFSNPAGGIWLYTIAAP